MPLFFTHLTNSEYWSRDDGVEHDGPETALALGVDSAVALSAEELRRGRTSTVVEVRIEVGDGTPLLRSVVSLSVSPLLLTA